jgi:hypothetical protein
MSWILSNSGTTASLTIGVETTLATDNNNATMVLEVDTSNLVNGDILEIRIYTVTLGGGSLIQAWKGTYQHAQVDNHKISPFIASDQSMKATLNQTAGTGRTYAWKILRQ